MSWLTRPIAGDPSGPSGSDNLGHMAHDARPMHQTDGTWAAFCPTEGRNIAVGQPLTCRELAEQLARSHRELHSPGSAAGVEYL